MNTNQAINLFTKIIIALCAWVTTKWGFALDGPGIAATAAPALVAWLVWWWSHRTHATPPELPGTPQPSGKNFVGLFLLGFWLAAVFTFCGCASNHKGTTYRDPIKAMAVTTPNGTTLYPSGWTCFMNSNGAVIFLPTFSAAINTNKSPFSLADFFMGGFRTATLYTESPYERHTGGGVNLLVDSKYNQLNSEFSSGTRWGGQSQVSIGTVEFDVSTNGITATGNAGNQLLQGVGGAVGNIISNAKK